MWPVGSDECIAKFEKRINRSCKLLSWARVRAKKRLRNLATPFWVDPACIHCDRWHMWHEQRAEDVFCRPCPSQQLHIGSQRDSANTSCSFPPSGDRFKCDRLFGIVKGCSSVITLINTWLCSAGAAQVDSRRAALDYIHFSFTIHLHTAIIYNYAHIDVTWWRHSDATGCRFQQDWRAGGRSRDLNSSRGREM